jgi:hypothetical protein
MHELALEDDELLLSQAGLLRFLPQLVQLLVLEKPSPEMKTIFVLCSSAASSLRAQQFYYFSLEHKI